MSGAAAVMGAMLAIARLKPGVSVLGVAPCTENMPSGTATKPGDVVYAMDGQSIEVLNTDAEGRLVLADALTGRPLDVPPATTALGGLWRHVRGSLRAPGNTEYTTQATMALVSHVLTGRWASVVPKERPPPESGRS